MIMIVVSYYDVNETSKRFLYTHNVFTKSFYKCSLYNLTINSDYDKGRKEK